MSLIPRWIRFQLWCWRSLSRPCSLTFCWSIHITLANYCAKTPKQFRLGRLSRAEEYIEANWSEAITIESIADAVGTSARSIFLSFRQSRGYTPMAFVKATRLRHAQQKLLAANREATVTSVALECGFQNMGHFAINYRKLFGKSPSGTLESNKGPLAAQNVISAMRRTRSVIALIEQKLRSDGCAYKYLTALVVPSQPVAIFLHDHVRTKTDVRSAVAFPARSLTVFCSSPT